MKEPNKNQKQPSLGRSFLIRIAIFAVMFFLLQLVCNKKTDVEILTYSQFVAEVEKGAVDSLTVNGNEIFGLLKNPTAKKTEKAFTKFRTTVPPEVRGSLLADLAKRGVSVKIQSEGSLMRILVNILPIALFFFFLIWIMGRAGGQTRDAFKWGQSIHKQAVDDEKTKITFKDVAGVDEALEEVKEVVDFLKDPMKFGRLGAKVPRGILLAGAPGCGKTLLAQAVAGESGVPFLSMSGSDFMEIFVGVGASRVRSLFEKARQQAPSIIFIDEIDAIGRHRGAGVGGGHDEREQTLNAIFVEMDGFVKNKVPVIIMAATNRPDILDPALTRPGRFDRQVVVPLPDIRGRAAILAIHSRDKKLASDIDLERIAKITSGFSGADLANLMNEAALLAARREAESIAMEDISEARDKVTMGTKRRVVMSEEDKKLVAYHEAGHALVAEFIPEIDKVNKVTIIPRGFALGMTQLLPEKERYNPDKKYLEGLIAMGYGGRVAEEMFLGVTSAGAQNDIQQATGIIQKMVCEWGMSKKLGLISYTNQREEVFLAMEMHQKKSVSEETARLIDEEVKRISTEAYNRAKKILEEHKDILEKLAKALVEKETLEAAEVKQILGTA